MVIGEGPFGPTSGGEKLIRAKPLISTNEAYQLAAGWLRAIDVDVQELERTNQVEVQRQTWTSGGEQVLSPTFEVKWGKWDEPKVSVTVNGRAKKLIQLRENDLSFSRRPRELIKDLDKLLAIPDEEFLKYSPTERSNLVARFAATSYPAAPQASAAGALPQPGTARRKPSPSKLLAPHQL